MNEEIKSVLRFENYIVKKVLFEYNLQYNNEEAIDIKFDVDADYCVNEEDGSMQVTLETYVFNGEDKTKYPFSMEMEVVGFFSISNVSEEQIEKEEMLTLVDLLVALDNAETEQAVDYLLEVPQEAKRCALYGEGISEKVVYYLDRGLIQSLVVPNEFHMGYQSVKEMSRQLSYSPTIGESSQVGFLVVDKENLYKADNQKILFPIVQ